MNGCLGYSTERPGRVPGSTGPREWNLGEEGGGSETRVICGGDSWCRKGEPPAFLPGDGGRKQDKGSAGRAGGQWGQGSEQPTAGAAGRLLGAPDGLWRPGPHTPGRVATAKGRKWTELASATKWEG